MKTTTIQALHTAAFTGLLSLAILSPAIAADFTGSLKEVTITDSKAANKPPVATFTYTVNGETVTFDASGSHDPDGNIINYLWEFGDESSGEGVQVSHFYANKNVTRVTLNIVDNDNGVTLSQKEVNLQQKINISINFQPSSSPIPEGYLADAGDVFSYLKGFGWSSLPSSLGARDRDSSLSKDQTYDTLIHVSPTGIFEIVVPNGEYSVTVCVGDPSYPDGTNSVQVEGVPIITNVTLSDAMKWIEKSTLVKVADGKITVRFEGSTPAAKINWIKIMSN